MEIQHTHPEFDTPEERLERLRELRQACLSVLTRSREKAGRTV